MGGGGVEKKRGGGASLEWMLSSILYIDDFEA